jgi:hypothetical protein
MCSALFETSAAIVRELCCCMSTLTMIARGPRAKYLFVLLTSNVEQYLLSHGSHDVV